ncbi:Acetyltransferase (GNAT) family protein [Hartmannibacter diazotrophicus]|uniref:Acetyltransferase (GNAT) family protein n=1 Tax=Hartmannibacter diazotrophicus TaxID=1482074 RepID=A0A2C9D5Y4_9HYPH|nr:GNAT family N-acetyltransferase [Hartmannibacter diazotrophicus]SON55600.1 Acetyltransferase (GNAT) family protein [Hartmannibacter diazotrophicus]
MTAKALADGFHPVPKGKIATVVTFLERTVAPEGAPFPCPDGFRLERADGIGTEEFRALFRRIGEDWMWWSRLAMDETALAALLSDPRRDIQLARRGDEAVGIVELDFTDPANVELAFFGLVPGIEGKGIGRWLMDAGLRIAFASPETRRVFVHTCHFDSPRALPFYMASGFRAYDVQVEVCDDPRLVGLLPESATPQVPVIC